MLDLSQYGTDYTRALMRNCDCRTIGTSSPRASSECPFAPRYGCAAHGAAIAAASCVLPRGQHQCCRAPRSLSSSLIHTCSSCTGLQSCGYCTWCKSSLQAASPARVAVAGAGPPSPEPWNLTWALGTENTAPCLHSCDWRSGDTANRLVAYLSKQVVRTARPIQVRPAVAAVAAVREVDDDRTDLGSPGLVEASPAHPRQMPVPGAARSARGSPLAPVRAPQPVLGLPPSWSKHRATLQL